MDIMIYAIPVFFILIGVELLVAKLHKEEAYRLGDAVSNISCGVVQQVLGFFLKAATFGLYALIFNYLRVMDVPNIWWSYIILFLLVDFIYYWFHRYSHEISLFWGAHVVHHQSEDYNLSVALRQSAFQGLISALFYLPLAFLGFEPLTFLLINTLQTLYQFWIHTEQINKLPRWFEYIFNTPSHHRVHHGRNPQYIDKNHGGTLIIFDRMFGTFQAEDEEVVYGVTTPLRTWSPIWANFAYFRDLGRSMARVDGWGDRLRMIFKNPGWLPQRLGGTPPFEEVKRQTTQKYSTSAPMRLNFYVLIQYAIALGGATYFLATAEQQSLTVSLILAGLVVLSMASLSALLDRRDWAWRLESFRLLLLLGSGIFVVINYY